ncbi:ABC transporter substrate-binding protein [Staphylococcus aureus]
MFINNEDTFMGQFLIKMGIQPEVTKDQNYVGERKGGPYIYLNNEELANINPKVMILATDGKTDKRMEQNTLILQIWKSLKAVKDNKVYDVDRNKWLKSRGIIASESMAEDLEKIVEKAK